MGTERPVHYHCPEAERSMRMKPSIRCLCVAVSVSLIVPIAAAGTAQEAKPAANYPGSLPYSFGNFIWWSDDELRVLLKKRIPGLGDEIATTTAAEGRIRDALKALLKENGIAAEIQSQEPSYSSFGASPDPEAPVPSIQFSIMSPQILLDKVQLRVTPVDQATLVTSEAEWGQGKPYTTFGDWYIRSRIKTKLHQKGYLDTEVQISRSSIRKNDDQYLVGLDVDVIAGPQYHVSAISADGGPLLQGKDLSPFFGMRVGDVPTRSPMQELAGKLREFYLHYGYADVEVENLPVLDREHATVAYNVKVVPGLIYHLRSLTVQNLNAQQESKAKELLGMKTGDIYLEEKIADLYRKIADEPLLQGYRFGYGVKKDKAVSEIDLTLNFFKEGNESSVTIK